MFGESRAGLRVDVEYGRCASLLQRLNLIVKPDRRGDPTVERGGLELVEDGEVGGEIRQRQHHELKRMGGLNALPKVRFAGITQ